MAALTILIPSRQEEWLNRTVADVLANARADTDVVVVLDGAWPQVPLPVHPRVTVLYHPTAIGQRAATNEAARIARSRYVMKVDAHVAFAPGFDTVLLEAAATLPRETVQVPSQRNLNVWEWVCPCGWRGPQSPPLPACPACKGAAPVVEVMWRPRRGSTTSAWRFDAALHFQYAKEQQKRLLAAAAAAGQPHLPETMSLLGACWFLEREWFLGELGGLDEAHGSWGQMGTEVACKAWLSGGRVVTNMQTWFAHFFRVNNISVPYPGQGESRMQAQAYSRDLWLSNGWPGQVRPLRWLVDKFWPVDGWTEAQRDALPPLETPATVVAVAEPEPPPAPPQTTAGVLYYSDHRADAFILGGVRRQMVRAATGLPIVAVTLPRVTDNVVEGLGVVPLQPFAGMRHVVLPLERGYLTMARQILTGLQLLDTDVVFFCEHDVLYPPEHFTHRPSSDQVYAYNVHVWKVDAAGGRALHYRCEQLSGLCADRRLLLEHFRARVAHMEQHGFTRRLGFEPGKPTRHGGLDDIPRERWMSATPLVDIRHDRNLTPSRWRREQFRNPQYTEGWTEGDGVPGWGRTLDRFQAWFDEVTHAV